MVLAIPTNVAIISIYPRASQLGLRDSSHSVFLLGDLCPWSLGVGSHIDIGARARAVCTTDAVQRGTTRVDNDYFESS